MPDDSKSHPVVTQRVRERLKELGWYGGGDDYNASDFARRVDIGYATAHALLAGDTSSPDATTLEKVADTMRVSVDWLLGREKEFDARAYDLGRKEAEGERAVRLQVIGKIADGKISPQTLETIEDLHRLGPDEVLPDEVARWIASRRRDASEEAQP